MNKVLKWIASNYPQLDYIAGSEEDKNKLAKYNMGNKSLPDVSIISEIIEEFPYIEPIITIGNLNGSPTWTLKLDNMFRRYESISNKDSVDLMERIKEYNASYGELYVTEKINGRNFSFLTNGYEIWEAQRKDLLINIEYPRDATGIIPDKNVIIDLFNTLSKKHDLTHIQVYGEMFGGSYPHKDVPFDKKTSRISKGVYYHPSYKFLAFDILLNGKTYVSAEQKYELFQSHNIPYIKPLFKGTFSECMEYPNNFPSTIAEEYFNLPKIEPNICEGVVITPAFTKDIGSIRCIIKNKHEKFKEISRKRKDPPPQIEISEVLSNALTEACRYVTMNRFENVLSHCEEFKSIEQFDHFRIELLKDTMQDFIKDNSKMFEVLTKVERKHLNKYISKECSKVIKEYIKNVSTKLYEEMRK